MESAPITYEQLKKDPRVLTYIQQADAYVKAIGYIRHDLAHVTSVAERASSLLLALGYEPRYAEIVKIAGLLHDIGNTVNRIEHAQSGACMAFSLLESLQMDPGEISVICTAIGNHDEHTGVPVSPAAAAIILADKTDVRRSRARYPETLPAREDIHNRVNYAVKAASLTPDPAHRELRWEVDSDPAIADEEDFMSIYAGRMEFCCRAAETLGLRFRLFLNGMEIALP